MCIQLVLRRARVQVITWKWVMKNPIKVIIFLWLLPYFQYWSLRRYVRFISLGATQMRLSYQQAAIPNKPVGGEIWQGMTDTLEGTHRCSSQLQWMNQCERACLSQQWNAATSYRQMHADARGATWEAVSHSDSPIRSGLTVSGQVESAGYEQREKQWAVPSFFQKQKKNTD